MNEKEIVKAIMEGKDARDILVEKMDRKTMLAHMKAMREKRFGKKGGKKDEPKADKEVSKEEPEEKGQKKEASKKASGTKWFEKMKWYKAKGKKKETEDAPKGE